MENVENKNSVCYIGIINEIKPIEGADNIELTIVNGWNAITKKGEYKIGDPVIIATTDAVIPEELSDKIGVTNYLRKGQRVRTVKLRGVYSECLIIPFSILEGKGVKNVPGTDLMDVLGIFKYEPPVTQIQLSNGKKLKYHQNPHFGIYYKFPNIKNVNGMFSEEDSVQITRKLHGTNARYGFVKKVKLSFWDKVKKFFKIGDELLDYEYVYGSHNVEKGSDSQGFYSTDVWRTIAEQLDIKNKLKKYALKLYKDNRLGNGIVIYGEIFGPGIQKNYDYGLKEIQFSGFDVVLDGKYEDIITTKLIFNEILNLEHTPVLYVGKWSQQIQDNFTFKNFIEGTKIPHEGIVIKHISGDRHKVAKVINPDYLIYSEKNDVGDSH